MAYDVGDMVRVQGTFTASGGAQVTPASVFLQIMNPATAVVTWGYIPSPAASGYGSVVSPTAGCFYVDQLASPPGNWSYRWAGEKTNWAAAVGAFSVNSDTFNL